MARRDVIEVTCDRCGRTETQGSTELPQVEGPEIEVSFHGERFVYNDLCKRCRVAVEGYFSRIAKKADEQAKKSETDEDAPEAASASTSETQGEAKKKGFLGLGG